MIIKGYGIELKRLTIHDIELVRLHRNSDAINQFMEYRQHITPQMQLNWFHSINNKQNNYFIITCGADKIGLINGAQIDWEKKETANGGIFIWNQEYIKTTIPICASFLLTDVSFILGLKKTYIKVLRDNDLAISYNKDMGYELLPGQENILNQQYVLTEENYNAKTQKLREMLIKRTSGIEFIMDNSQDEIENFYITLLTNLKEENKKKISLKIK